MLASQLIERSVLSYLRAWSTLRTIYVWRGVDTLASNQMKETEDRHEHMHTERSDIDHLSFSEILVEQQVLVYLSDTTGYIYTIIISYNIIS